MEGDTQDNMDNQLTPKSRKKGNKARSGSNFVVQGSILAVAGILVRIIGLAYRVPLTRTIGEEEMDIMRQHIMSMRLCSSCPRIVFRWL